MVDTARAQKKGESLQRLENATIFKRSRSEVRQDSIANAAMRVAVIQPASPGKLSRPGKLRKKSKRTQKRPVGNNTTIPTTIHLQPRVRQQLLDLAAGQTDPKLTSLSGIAVALIKRGLFAEPDKPYGPSLEPVVQGAIRKGFFHHDNRLAPLQARDTRDSAEARHLMANAVSLLLQLLGKFEDVAPDAFEHIITESAKKGREALTKPDPWLLELVQAAYTSPADQEDRVR
jgi:hypothetical protein